MKTELDFYDGTYWQYVKWFAKHWFTQPFENRGYILEALHILSLMLIWTVLTLLFPIAIFIIPIFIRRDSRRETEKCCTQEEIAQMRERKRKKNAES